MTSWECVYLAGLLRVIQSLAFYSRSSNNPAPQLPSLIVGLAAMDLIWDTCFVPQALHNLPALIRRMYEVLVSYLLLGIAVQVIWKSVDFICVILMRVIMLGNGLVSEIDYNNYESYWVGMVTVPLSLLILSLAGHGIDYFHMLHNIINIGIINVQSKV